MIYEVEEKEFWTTAAFDYRQQAPDEFPFDEREVTPEEFAADPGTTRLFKDEQEGYIRNRWPGMQWQDCPQCGARGKATDTNLGLHCFDCDWWEPGGKERKDQEWHERNSATSPYQYEFVPLTDYELGLFSNLPRDNKQQWYERAKRLNTRSRKLGEEGMVGAKELFALLMRHENQCVYCDKQLAWTPRGGESPMHQNVPGAGTFDHNIPLSEGGENTAANLVPACWHCNRELNFQNQRTEIRPHPQTWEQNPLLDTPQPVVASAKVKCPNCGLEALAEVCENCGKPLGPEWIKQQETMGDAGWDGPRLPTHRQDNEFLSDPQRVDKTNWDKTDNSYPSMIS